MFDRRPNFFRADDESGGGRRVEATVKWFNASKGFGFVSLSDGSPDAFLPMAALRRAGRDDVRDGAAITCEIGTGAKGPLVTAVLHLDNSAAPSASVRPVRAGARPAQSLEGSVKWFEADRGFGFIAPDGGGKDIFVHVTALRRSGIDAVAQGQRVRVETVEGRKGLEAERVMLI
jgi:CspA family cold shock protein